MPKLSEIPEIYERWKRRSIAIYKTHMENNPSPNPKAVRLYLMIYHMANTLADVYHKKTSELLSKRLDNYPAGGVAYASGDDSGEEVITKSKP